METDTISCISQFTGITPLWKFWVVLHQNSILHKRPKCQKIATTQIQIQGFLVSRLFKPRIIVFKDCWIQGLLNSRTLSSRVVESKIVEYKDCWIQGLLNPRVVESKGCWIQGLLNLSIVECEYCWNVFSFNLLVIESMYFLMQWSLKVSVLNMRLVNPRSNC